MHAPAAIGRKRTHVARAFERDERRDHERGNQRIARCALHRRDERGEHDEQRDGAVLARDQPVDRKENRERVHRGPEKKSGDKRQQRKRCEEHCGGGTVLEAIAILGALLLGIRGVEILSRAQVYEGLAEDREGSVRVRQHAALHRGDGGEREEERENTAAGARL
jgi:hypothetical protein